MNRCLHCPFVALMPLFSMPAFKKQSSASFQWLRLGGIHTSNMQRSRNQVKSNWLQMVEEWLFWMKSNHFGSVARCYILSVSQMQLQTW